MYCCKGKRGMVLRASKKAPWASGVESAGRGFKGVMRAWSSGMGPEGRGGAVVVEEGEVEEGEWRVERWVERALRRAVRREYWRSSASLGCEWVLTVGPCNESLKC